MADFDKTQEFPINAAKKNGKKTAVRNTGVFPGRMPAVTRAGSSVQISQDLFHEIILIFSMDDGQIQSANQRAMEVTGYVQRELKYMKIGDLLPPEQLEQLWAALPDNGASLMLPDMELINRELELIPIEACALIFEGETDGQVLFTARDAGWRKASFQENVRNERFKTAERVSEIFSAFFFNQLSEIMSDLEFINNAVDPQSTFYRRLSETSSRCSVMMEVVEKLARLSGSGPFEPSVSSVGDILKHTAVSMAPEIAPEISVSDDLWPALIDRELLENGILTLFQYLSDGLTSGDRIRVDVKNSVNPVSSGQPLTGEYVEISIKAYGKSISADQFLMFFDPDVSFKKTDTLTQDFGLELALFYAVIKRHRAHMQLHPTAGEKTDLSFYFPAVRHSPIVEKMSEIPDYFEGKRGESRLEDEVLTQLSADIKGRVLFLDDEEIVRVVTGEMLGILGYQVRFTENGEDAVARYRDALKQGKPYDVVILDLNIAEGMGGETAMKALLKIDPAVRGIVSSGYSTDPGMMDYKRCGFKAMIGKPYTLKDLKEAIDEAMK